MRRLALVLASLLSGCSTCSPHTVTFGLDAGSAAPLPQDGVDLGVPAFAPVEAHELPDATRSVDVEGAQVMSPAGTSTSLRSVLAMDVDGDGDRDAVLITTDETGAPSLAFATRDANAFTATRVIAPLQLGAGCSALRIAMRALSARWAVATLTPTCTLPDGGVSGSGAPITWLVALAAPPRLRDRIVLLPADARATGDVAIGVRIVDVDGDGRDDVKLDVGVTARQGDTPQTVTLTWLDRPAGLARDTHEPEATLREVAQRAKQKLRRDPTGAMALARAAIAAHDVVCREGPGPRIVFGDAEGVPCGASRGAGVATAVLAAASARAGDVLGALSAQGLLASPSLDVPRADRDLATRALSSLPSEAGATWLVGPQVTQAGGPDAHLPAIGFVDDHTIVLRGNPTRTWGMEAGVDPQIVDGPQVDWLIRGPTGENAIVDVHRACDGYHLGVVASANVLDGVVVGGYREDPIALPAPMAGACGRLPENVRRETGGLSVLGWAPQGAVLTRGGELWLAPLTATGASAGTPSRLPDGAALPAPLSYGAAAPDGRAFAVGTPYGVIVRELVPASRTVFLHTADWDTATGDVTDVAISPDAKQVAIVKGGMLYVIRRAG